MIQCIACAEPGVVDTRGGKLNMRKSPQDGARIITKISNGAGVEILEHLDGWYRISFRNKEGYVKEQYIRPLSDAVGKEIYSNGATVYVYEAMTKESGIVGMINSQQAMKVEQLTAEWALVSCDDISGYVQTDSIDQLNGEPIAAASNTWEAGVLQSKTVLYKQPNKKSKLGTYQRGQLVYISKYDKNWSLIWIADEGVYGFAQKPSVKLSPATAEEEIQPGDNKPFDEDQYISSGSAKSIAEKALKKYSGFNSGKLNCTQDIVLSSNGIKGPMYRFYYFNKKDEYLYAAYVQAYTGDVLYTGDYSGFVYGKGASDLKTAAPTAEPVYEYDESGNLITPVPQAGTDIGQSAARSIADRYLASRYPQFSSMSFSRVQSQHFTEYYENSFQTPNYQFDYYVRNESGSEYMTFEIIIHAYTKEILYCCSDGPGEGNG
jgi:SH3-like domain-containing protein